VRPFLLKPALFFDAAWPGICAFCANNVCFCLHFARLLFFDISRQQILCIAIGMMDFIL
jgi:hypothetical protein